MSTLLTATNAGQRAQILPSSVGQFLLQLDNDSLWVATAEFQAGAFAQITGGGGGQVVYNIMSYGAHADGTTDDTAALQAAINAAQAANGGVVYIPAGTYRIAGQITFPDSGTTPYLGKSITLKGDGCSTTGTNAAPSGGTILDCRYSGAGYKFWARGTRYLEITGITFKDDSAANSTPLFIATRTTCFIHENEFVGNPSKSGSACDQDMLTFGGTSITFDGTINEPAAGYYTCVIGNKFHRTRQGVVLNTFANGYLVFRNHWSIECGAVDGTTAAIHVVGHDSISTANQTSGCRIRENLIEMTGYVYGIKLSDSQGNYITGNEFWDPTGGTSLAGIRFESTSIRNEVSGNFYPFGLLTLVSDASAGPNLIIDGVAGTISGVQSSGLSGAGTQELTVINTNTNARVGVLANAAGTAAVRGGTTLDANAFWQILAGAGKMAIESYNRAVRFNGRIGSSADAGNIPFVEFMNGATQTGKTVRGLTSDGATELWAFDFAGGLTLAGGSTLKKTLSATATLDFPSITATGGTQDLTITVTGAAVGDSVFLGLPAAPNAGVTFNAFVSASNTVTVRATNCTAGAIDPASATFRVTVLQF